MPSASVFTPGTEAWASSISSNVASADGTVKIWDARPWTPELRGQAQARSVLKRYRQQVESLENLRAQVRDAEHLSGLARERALEWSELFWINREEQ